MRLESQPAMRHPIACKELSDSARNIDSFRLISANNKKAGMHLANLTNSEVSDDENALVSVLYDFRKTQTLNIKIQYKVRNANHK